MIDERHVLDADTFVEIVVWRVQRAPRGSAHRFKYRLALGQIIIERATFGCASSGCLIGISLGLEYRYVIIPGDVPA